MIRFMHEVAFDATPEFGTLLRRVRRGRGGRLRRNAHRRVRGHPGERHTAAGELQDAELRDVAQQVLAIVHRSIGKFEYDREKGRFATGWELCTAHEISRYQRKERRTGKGVGEGRSDDLAQFGQCRRRSSLGGRVQQLHLSACPGKNSSRI